MMRKSLPEDEKPASKLTLTLPPPHNHSCPLVSPFASLDLACFIRKMGGKVSGTDDFLRCS